VRKKRTIAGKKDSAKKGKNPQPLFESCLLVWDWVSAEGEEGNPTSKNAKQGPVTGVLMQPEKLKHAQTCEGGEKSLQKHRNYQQDKKTALREKEKKKPKHPLRQKWENPRGVSKEARAAKPSERMKKEEKVNLPTLETTWGGWGGGRPGKNAQHPRGMQGNWEAIPSRNDHQRAVGGVGSTRRGGGKPKGQHKGENAKISDRKKNPKAKTNTAVGLGGVLKKKRKFYVSMEEGRSRH